MRKAVVAEEESEIFRECDLDDKFRKPRSESKERILENFRTKCSSRKHCWGLIKSRLPIVDWLPRYSLKRDAFGDVTAGLTVGVVHIPQGLAYAQLASLPPVVGLYVSSFPVLMYPIFGTSKHISMGTFAIVSVIVSSVLTQHVPSDYCGPYTSSTTFSPISRAHFSTGYTTMSIPANTTTADTDCLQKYDNRMIEVCSALSLCVGLVQVLMHICHLGVVAAFLSESLLSGFLCGSAFVVIATQLSKLFGIKIDRQSAPFGFIKIFVELIRNISDTNIATLIVSILCVTFLMIGKTINERYKAKLRIPIPWELFLVAISTSLSYLLELHAKYDVDAVGIVPSAIALSAPNGGDVVALFFDSIPVAIASFAIAISLCRMYAIKHSYNIDSNQEFLALGMCNILGSFFSCYPCGPALSRSSINDGVGVKSQLGSYLSSIVVAVVLLWMGPLFEALPQAALAAIIIVNIRHVTMYWKKVPHLWRISRLDAVTWIVACFAVISSSVSVGLVTGVGFSILTVLIRMRRAPGISLRKVLAGGVYRNTKKYHTLSNKDLLIYQFTGPLFFGNKDRFNDSLIGHLGYDPVKLNLRREAEDDIDSPSEQIRETSSIEEQNLNTSDLSQNRVDIPMITKRNTALLPTPYRVVILDMVRCSFTDSDGARTLTGVCVALQGLGLAVMIVSCTDHVKSSLKASWENVDDVIFVSLESAIKYSNLETLRT